MSNCVFCGHETTASVDHFHGSESKVCKSIPERRVNCRSDWQNFKMRVEKYKKSKYPEVQAFAFRVEKEVFENGEPAIDWNKQLIIVRKLVKKMPMIPEQTNS